METAPAWGQNAGAVIPMRQRRGVALTSTWAVGARSWPADETAPLLREEIAGAATFSRFVSTIPRERWIRLSATLQVPKNGPTRGWRAQRSSAFCSLLDRHCRLFPLLSARQTGTH